MKKFTQTISKLTLAASMLLFGAGAFGQTQTVWEIINTSNDHETLAAAIVAAGLDGALDDPDGEFTVFAPDDDAFDDLLAELGLTAAQLLADPDLDDYLLYHVISGATVNAADLSNGQIEEPMNNDNTLKFTVTSGGSVFVNQAQVNGADLAATNGVVHSIDAVVLASETVVDIALGSAAHTILVQAVVAAELLPALTDPFAELTVFAPTNDAFTDALDELDLTAAQLLASADLADILLYHVLGTEEEAADLSNGQLAEPLNTANTIKITITSDDDVFVNQAQVTTPDVGAENGVVHVIDAVIFADETVADIAIGSAAHTTLVQAVIAAELLPALTDPFAELTVFAPTNDAFADALAELGISAQDLLEDDDLADILLYHVLGAEVESGDLANGLLAQPLNPDNTIKITVTGGNDVFANQAQVTTPDLSADNGVVHVLDAVILPAETVVDVALGSTDHTALVLAVVTAELLPALTNPFEEYTLFAPTNAAFADAAAALGLDLTDVLALSFLDNILLYHVVGGTVLSTDLTNGPVTTLNGEDVVVDLTSGVMINQANVTTPDLTSDNGVVHVIDAVLLPEILAVDDMLTFEKLVAYPNPTTDVLNVTNVEGASYTVVSITGAVVAEGVINNGMIDVQSLNEGTYMININDNQTIYQGRFIKM